MMRLRSLSSSSRLLPSARGGGRSSKFNQFHGATMPALLCCPLGRLGSRPSSPQYRRNIGSRS
eukprot:10328599-Alexandrium_andersonii.AAC.1